MKPTPTLSGTQSGARCWRVDLRWAGHGRYWLSAPPVPAGEIAAVHEAYALLGRLQIEARGRAPELPGIDGRPLFSLACDEYLSRKTWRSRGGERWAREIVTRLRADWGATALAEWTPPAGDDLFADLIARARVGSNGRPPIGPKRAEDLIVVALQILRVAVRRRLLAAVPLRPSPKLRPEEEIRNPQSRWIDEATVRLVRAALFSEPQGRHCLGEDPEGTIARRKLFVSFALYTGMRRNDLERLRGEHVSADLGFFQRYARKTRSRVLWEPIVAPLAADIQAELRRLGRPFLPDELIAGGPWKNVARVLSATAARIERPAFNLRDLRRSFVYHKALAGVGEDALIRAMGHADSRMIRAVYLQVPPRCQRDKVAHAWPTADDVRRPSTSPAQVLEFKPTTVDEVPTSAKGGRK